MKTLLLSLLLLPLTQAATVTVTIPPSIPSDEPQYTSTAKFQSAILNSTNFYRDEHNATALTWNKTLATFASDYLSSLSDCQFKHSGGPYGENLAIGYANVTAGVEGWGNERDEYNFGDPGFTHDTGHFTQLVWKNTTTVGCGRKLCGEKGWYLVCEYWPRGNVIGQFGEEVDREEGGASGLTPPASLLFFSGLVWLLKEA